MNPEDRTFQISHIFQAPREALWRMWTNPGEFARWLGRTDYASPVCRIDLQLGGQYEIVIRDPNGTEYPSEGIYTEILAPERLVMTMDCSRHPESWHDLLDPGRDKSRPPRVVVIQTITFEALEQGTRMTIRTDYESAAICQAMLRLGTPEAWRESFVRLADCVASPL